MFKLYRSKHLESICSYALILSLIQQYCYVSCVLIIAWITVQQVYYSPVQEFPPVTPGLAAIFMSNLLGVTWPKWSLITHWAIFLRPKSTKISIGSSIKELYMYLPAIRTDRQADSYIHVPSKHCCRGILREYWKQRTHNPKPNGF